MDLRSFAEDNRLRVRRDEDNTQIITGKVGHLWEYGEGKLAVTLLDLTPTKWGFRRNACLAVGMQLDQDGHDEGTLLFDPVDEEQVEMALKVAEVKRKRRVSPETLERLRAMSARNQIRKDSPVEGRGSTNDGRDGKGCGSDKGIDLPEFPACKREGSEAA